MSVKVVEDESISVVKLIDTIWEKYDEDGNGTINQEEAKQFIQEFLGHGVTYDQEYLLRLFSQVDTNHDGQVDKEEMNFFITSIREDQTKYTMENLKQV